MIKCLGNQFSRLKLKYMEKCIDINQTVNELTDQLQLIRFQMNDQIQVIEKDIRSLGEQTLRQMRERITILLINTAALLVCLFFAMQLFLTSFQTIFTFLAFGFCFVYLFFRINSRLAIQWHDLVWQKGKHTPALQQEWQKYYNLKHSCEQKINEIMEVANTDQTQVKCELKRILSMPGSIPMSDWCLESLQKTDS